MFIAVLFFFFTSLQAEIIETQEIEAVSEYLKEHTLVLFDIDDTLIRCDGLMGSSSCFYGLVDFLTTSGMDYEDALNTITEADPVLQSFAKMEPCQPTTASFVRYLQKRQIPVVGLTARTRGIAQKTRELLLDQNIDFSLGIVPDLTADYPGSEIACYRHGVLFCGDALGKAKVLDWFLKNLHLDGVPVERIVFVDDKRQHLETVEAYADERGIPFIGLRYGKEDARRAGVTTEKVIAEVRANRDAFPREIQEKWASIFVLE